MELWPRLRYPSRLPAVAQLLICTDAGLGLGQVAVAGAVWRAVFPFDWHTFLCTLFTG